MYIFMMRIYSHQCSFFVEHMNSLSFLMKPSVYIYIDINLYMYVCKTIQIQSHCKYIYIYIQFKQTNLCECGKHLYIYICAKIYVFDMYTQNAFGECIYIYIYLYVCILQIYLYMYIYIQIYTHKTTRARCFFCIHIYEKKKNIYIYTYINIYQRSGFHEHSKKCSRRSENVEMMSFPDFFFEVEVEDQPPLSSSCRGCVTRSCTDSCLHCLYTDVQMYSPLCIRIYIHIFTYIYISKCGYLQVHYINVCIYIYVHHTWFH